MSDVTLNTAMHTIGCGLCGGVYALNSNYVRDCRQEGRAWTCPYCRCSWGYRSDNENARLKRQLEDACKLRDIARRERDIARDRADRFDRSRRAYKGQLTRTKNRVKNGVCPCCNRSFDNLARHMKSKHPNYGEVSE